MQGDNSSNDRDSTLKQLEIYLDVYKHHFDLFLKGIVVYLAVVGALGGYLYASDVSSWQKIGLASFITVGSLVAVWACHLSNVWVRDVAGCVHGAEEELGTLQFPFSGAYGTLRVMTLTAGLFAAAGLVQMAWFFLT